MIELDLKDRKILYELDLNCRQSDTQIGKKVGLSRQVVEYRIKSMEEKGIIKNYFTVINSYKLGFDAYRYYIKLQNTTKKLKDEIGEYISRNKSIWSCGSGKSIYDLFFVVWVNDIQKFNDFLDDINIKYGDYFAEKIFSIYVKAHCYPKSYILGNEFKKKNRDIFQITANDIQVNIDNIDYKILDELAINARIPTVELAKHVELSSQNIVYRINKLIERNVIQAFRINIDFSKIGYNHFKVDIFLNKSSKRNKLWNQLKEIPNVTFINTSAGYADIEIEIELKSSDDILELMDSIMLKDEGLIKNYIYWGAEKFYKIRCLPEMKGEDFKKT